MKTRSRFIRQLIRKRKYSKQTDIRKIVVLTALSLATFIVIIPTVIVSVTTEKNSIQEEISEAKLDPQEDMNLTVPVMRTEKEAVEHVPLEDYVTGVVASEMPADFELEALKAQALAARTYVVNHLLRDENSDTPILDTVADQVYRDDDELRQLLGNEYKAKLEKIEQAVQATQSKILTYENKPITPAFFSTSNGYTENSEDYWESELPYLRSVKSDWDEESPKFLSQHIFTISELESLLNIPLNKHAHIQFETVRTESNRIKTVTVAGTEFSGRHVREQLNLPSNDFTIEQSEDHIIFTTKGYGHGVGMSQYGANGMAKEGKTYIDIVSHYYKNVDITDIEQIAPKLVLK